MEFPFRLTLLVLLLFVSLSHPADQPLAGEQVYRDSKNLGYWVYMPQEVEQREEWPLVVFLHGKGDGNRPELVLKHGLPREVADGQHFPFLLVSPRSGVDKWWSAPELKLLLDEVLATYPVDVGRVYLTGISMGGFGTWDLGAHVPQYFAALVPICGGGDPKMASKYSKLPIRAYHGDADQVVGLHYSQEMVNAVEREGGEVELIVLPDTGHRAWPLVYGDPEFWDWLLHQKRDDD